MTADRSAGPDGTGREPGAGTETGLAAEHARLQYDDAAYLLDALDADQRQAFERHLMRCPTCQDSVADLSELPAALGRADIPAWEPEPPPDTLLPRLLREVAAGRRRRAWQAAALGLAAACVVAVLCAGVILGWQQAHRPQTLAMQSVGPNAGSVHATVQLIDSDSGTRVKLDCGYRAGTGQYQTGTPSYRMIIFNRRGQQADLGRWTPLPGEDVQIARTSPWQRQNISRIEIADDQGQTVLRLSL